MGGYRLMSFRLLQGGFSYLFTTGIPGGQTLVIRWLRHPQCAGQTYMLSRGTAAGQKLRAGGVCGRQLPGWRRHTPAWGGMSEVCSISTSALLFANCPLPSAPWLRNEALLIALGSGRGPG